MDKTNSQKEDNLDVKILNSKLDALLSIAKSNEQKDVHYRLKELKLIKLDTLYSLLLEVTVKHEQDFYLDLSQLTLIRPLENHVSLALELEGNDIKTIKKNLQFKEKDFVKALFKSSRNPIFDTYSAEKYQGLINKNNIKSLAIIPIERKGEIVGVLTFASKEPTRFKKGMGTFLIGHYAAIISVCIDNALLLSRVKEHSLKDPLTGLWNRRFLHIKADRDFKNETSNNEFSLLVMDIDKFKAVNDTYGHDVGDIVLTELAKLTKEIIINEGTVCRFGGEEFIIWLPSMTNDGAKELAEKLRLSVQDFKFNESSIHSINMTVSIGIVTFPLSKEKSTQELLEEGFKKADEFLYLAKNSGRNRIISENESINKLA